MQPARIATISLLALLLPASGLSQPAAARNLTPTRTDMRFHLQEVLRIGSEDGENDAFGRIRDAAFSPSGRIYVADEQNHRVSVFDRDGRFVGHAGRRGQGPGELQSPWLVAADERDSLFVWDVAQARISVFSPDLSFRRSFSVPPQWLINGLEFLPNGRLLVSAYMKGSAGALHVLDRAGRIPSSFGPTFPKVDLAGFESSLLGGSIDFDEGTIVFSRKSPYEIFFFTAEGRLQTRCRGEERITTSPSEVVARTREGNGLRWNRYVHSAQVMSLGGGLFLNAILDPVQNRRTLDVLTRDCRLLRRTVMDGPLMLTDRRGTRILGIRSLDYPEVVIYEFRVQA